MESAIELSSSFASLEEALQPQEDARELAASSRDATRNHAPISGKCYMAYCLACLCLTGLLLLCSWWEAVAPRQAKFWQRRLRPWEEAGEAFAGAGLCMETLMALRLGGTQLLLRDCWRKLDAAVALLTLLCGVFFLFRRALKQVDEVVEEIDVPVLCIRFALQPIRMISTASMVVRAHRMVQSMPTTSEVLPKVDPRRPCENLTPMLSAEVAAELRECLPTYLKFRDWQLAYSPRVHGTSMNTFYRQQVGPNILVVRDASGGLFGGFTTEAWRPQADAYGSPESFVFALRPEKEQVEAAGPCCEGQAAGGESAEGFCHSMERCEDARLGTSADGPR
eukprot:TRINITY_DN84045_c0_g1_i1.p1 TRINITY_DN84045_c0_g1~~TRINITY_DN84045_c0_g1_i1.p1  ORF type:complete len:337 (+),score=62.73 TRINITY_DN84045_c0_g1_i1:93-1103(+)